MEQTNLEYQDFFTNVANEYKDFVSKAHELVLASGYSKISVGSNKSALFKVKYTHPKTRRGIINFTQQKKGLKATILAGKCAEYPDVLDTMPEAMVGKVAKVGNCLNISEPGKCMDKCVGYDFHIRGERYQKCKFGCFQFDVNDESIPFLLEMLECELAARQAA